MAAKIIDGVALGNRIRADIADAVAKLRNDGHPVQLNAILVGSSPAGELYARRQGEACRAVGIGYELVTLPAEATAEQVSGEIARLNADRAVTGIMLHQPLPPQLEATALQYQIAPVKDVEGVNPANLGYLLCGQTRIAPCTAGAVMEMIRSTGINLRGAEAVVVGASEIAGKPIVMLLSEERATVTLCRSATADLAGHTRRADVLVAAVGKVGLISGEMVRPGACVIDVGINRVRGADGTMRTVGDVDYASVLDVAGYVSPVPGGVGPVTVAMLLKNTLRGAMLALGK